MSGRIWRALDALTHVLYTPLAPRRYGRITWRHRVHLIPASAMALVCERYESALGEPADAAPTIGWRCEHLTITSGGAILSAPSAGCGCTMTPILAGTP